MEVEGGVGCVEGRKERLHQFKRYVGNFSSGRFVGIFESIL